MIDLREYVRKDVKVTCNDESIVIGFLSGIDDAESNEDGYESITLEETGISEYIGISAKEIKSIEVIKE